MTRTAPRRPSLARTDARPETELEFGTGIAALIYFSLALLYFLPAFLPGRMVYGTDFIAGGYFFYDFISQRFAAGELPKWVPYVYGGLPLAANPGSAYHPVHVIADLLLPTAKVLAAVFVFHFGVAGLGMYLLARELDCRRWVAFTAGLAFEFTGLTMSWVYAGHDGRIMVATVAPLFFFLLRRGIRTGALAPFAGAAATLGFALLSFQIQNSYYLLLAAALWAMFSLYDSGVARSPALLGRRVALGLAAVAFGFLLAAVNFLPFLDYVPESPRSIEGGRGYEYSTSYSMPAAELLSLAVPEQAGVSVADPETGTPLFPAYTGENGFKLHTEYVGALVVLLLAVGFSVSRRDRTWWFFLGLAVFALSIAFGGNTPLYRFYYAVLPGTKQFRAPSLSFFVVSLSLVSMAALTLERIARLREAQRTRAAERAADANPLRALPWILAGVVAVALLGGVLAAGGADSAAGAPTRAAGWMRFALFAALTAAVLWSWTAHRITSLAAALALAVVALLDLWSVDRKFFHTIDGPEVTFAADDVVTFLRSQPGPNRVWTFPFPQAYRSGGPNGGNYLMLFNIEQAGGEHPNPLQRWVAYLGAGERTFTDWHNFVAEGGVVETPEGQALAFRSEPGFLEAGNIRYVISMAPLVHPAFREVYRGSALIYENTAALPRAFLVPRVREVPPAATIAAMREAAWDPRSIAFVPAGSALPVADGPLTGGADVLEHEPDRIRIRTRASRPALLVTADSYYDGWKADIDGIGGDVIPTNNTMRGVVVPAGEHTVTLRFEPSRLYTGLYLTIAGFALLMGYGVFLLVQRRRFAGGAAAGG